MRKEIYDIVKGRVRGCLKNINTNFTAEKLAILTGIYTEEDWHRTVRRIVEELIIEGCPIGSGQDGFRWIRTDMELQRFLNGLQRRQVALCRRIANVYDAYQNTKS